jgi:DNA-binding XRE family transcriptional regulator
VPSQDATPSFYTAKPGDEFVDLDINDLLGEFSAEDQAEIVTITSTMVAEDRLYAQRLADLRRAVHLTQVDLARALGISQPAVASIERSVDPLTSTLNRYVSALGATAALVVTFPDNTTMTLPLTELAAKAA